MMTVEQADSASHQGECDVDGNARLIAAAPELLSALQEVTDAYEALLAEHGKPFGWGNITTENGRKAIAKATGK